MERVQKNDWKDKLTPYTFWRLLIKRNSLDIARLFISDEIGESTNNLIDINLVNKIPQFSFGSLTKDDIWRLCIEVITNRRSRSAFFSLIYSQQQVISMFTNHGDKVLRILEHFHTSSQWRRYGWIKYVLENMWYDQGSSKDFSPQNTYDIDQYINITRYPYSLIVRNASVGAFYNYLDKNRLFDVNRQVLHLNRNLLLSCCASSDVSTYNQIYYSFKYLVDHPENVDWTVKDRNGSNFIHLLKCNDKTPYISYLEEKVAAFNSNDQSDSKEEKENQRQDDTVVTGDHSNNNSYNKNVNLNQTMIDEAIKKYDTIEEIIEYSSSSNYLQLERLIGKIRSQSESQIYELLNGVGTKTMVTPLLACIRSQTKYNKDKPLQCANFQTFKYILQQKEIDLEKIMDDENIAQHCLTADKFEFWQYLLAQHGKDLSKKHDFLFPRMPVDGKGLAGTKKKNTFVY